jgi:signal transduction histidine kinase
MISGAAHIVLVEDNEATRYAVTRVLANAGYRVTPAQDGETGIHLARTLKPDLVLLDVKLPDVSGFEVVQRLKSDPATAAIPVVHLSATSVTTAEQVRGLEGGADAYLTHPVEPLVLVATLNALLRVRRAEARYRRVFETGLLGIVSWNAAGVIVDANDTFLRLVGYDRADVAAGTLRWEALVGAAPDGATGPPPRSVGPGGGPSDLVLARRDGGRVPVLIGGSPDEGSDEAVAFVLDISERKRAEEALREADRRKDEFLAVLSHELRNPLAPIRNGIYVLTRAKPESSQAARAMQVIERQVEHLTRLVDDLLDVTRISRGKIELQRARVDLREVVRKTADDMHSMFEEAAVELRLERSPGALWVNADATRLAQVVANLLHNAVKFTPAGGTVAVQVADRDGRGEVRVRDSGIGIEPGEVTKMFEPFAQADRGLARAQGGLGLGLALVLGLVEMHGGTVSARSEGPGRGAEFTISLPLATGSKPGAARPPGREAVRTRRVLVIEDNADAAQSLADILELRGHDVRVASDGRTGIDAALRMKPDVILCDIGLPDIDGYEVARAVRAEAALKETRLIAVSGYARPQDRERARQAGFEAHVAKPAGVEMLDELLARDAASMA